MSALLAFLQITDKRSYHQWCLENHPDKCPDNPDATRKFQEVGAEWRRVNGGGGDAPQRKPQRKPRPQWDDHAAHCREYCVQTGLPTESGWCWRRKHEGSAHCYYHMPGTNHMRFADRPPHELFNRFHVFHKKDFFRGERTAKSCEAKCANGQWCVKPKQAGERFCHTHNPANCCGHPTKSGKSCSRPKTKGGTRCAQHTTTE